MQKSTAMSYVIGVFCFPAFALTNLVVNPGFEQGLFAGWRGNAKYAKVDSVPHSGKVALQVPTDAVPSIIYQDIKVKPGKVYTISGWIKQDGDAASGTVSYIYYKYFNTAGVTSATKVLHSQYIEYFPNTGYTQTKNYSLAPDSAVTLRIELQNTGAGAGYHAMTHFDDISVIEDEYVTNQANILTNPDFENGLTGWTGSAVTTNEMSHRGSYSMKINNNGGWAEVYQMVPAAPGDGFSFTGWACLRTLSGDSAMNLSPVGPSAFVLFSYVGAGSNEAFDLGYDNFATWHKWAMETRIAPPGTTGLWIQCWVFQGGPYLGYFDDFKLFKFTKNPNPPAIKPLTISKGDANSNPNARTFDIFGRRILSAPGPVRGMAQRPASGVYFTLNPSSRSEWAKQ